jgi:site-specific DNA recombinase
VDAEHGKLALIYVRQSIDHAEGIERQLKLCRELAERRGFTVPDGWEFTDNDVSASKNRRRPGYEQAMALVRKGDSIGRPDVWVSTFMDRIYRKPIELELIWPEFEQAKVVVATVNEGDMDFSIDTDLLRAGIQVQFARAEMRRKSARQKGANKDRAQNGVRSPHGIVPFGWKTDRITPDEDEAEAIRWAAQHILSGGSIAAIVREWTSRGVRSRYAGRTYTDEDGNEIPFSGKWTGPTVTRIMTSPSIAGLMVYQGEIIGSGNWTQIITPETFYAMRDVLRDPTRATPRGKVSLGGFLFHCRCGAKVQGDQRYGKRQKGDPAPYSYAMYRCQEYTSRGERRRPGPHVAMRAAPIDAYVTQKLLDEMRKPDAAAIFQKHSGTDVPKLKAERKEISDGLARMAGDEAMGLLPRAIYLDAAKRVTARLEEIDALIAEAGEVDTAALLLSADDPAEVWEAMDITVRRKVIESLMHVTLRSPGCGCRNPDMDQLVRVAWRRG